MDVTAFANAVVEGRIALSANDTLRCRLIEEQRLSASGLAKETRVVEVLEHIPGARQMRLF